MKLVQFKSKEELQCDTLNRLINLMQKNPYTCGLINSINNYTGVDELIWAINDKLKYGDGNLSQLNEKLYKAEEKRIELFKRALNLARDYQSIERNKGSVHSEYYKAYSAFRVEIGSHRA